MTRSSGNGKASVRYATADGSDRRGTNELLADLHRDEWGPVGRPEWLHFIEGMPETLTNPVLLGSLIVPIGLQLRGEVGDQPLAVARCDADDAVAVDDLLRRTRYLEVDLSDPAAIASVLVPVGSFNEGANVTLWAGVSPKRFTTLTVTREQADGVQASSGEKVLVGPVTGG